MSGDLTDDIRIQLVQAQVNQTSGTRSQAQVATTVQVQSQTVTVTSTPVTGQALPSKTTATTTTANSNGLEPYGPSVRVVTCLRNTQPSENPNYVYTIQPYQ